MALQDADVPAGGNVAGTSPFALSGQAAIDQVHALHLRLPAPARFVTEMALAFGVHGNRTGFGDAAAITCQILAHCRTVGVSRRAQSVVAGSRGARPKGDVRGMRRVIEARCRPVLATNWEWVWFFPAHLPCPRPDLRPGPVQNRPRVGESHFAKNKDLRWAKSSASPAPHQR